MHKWSTFEIIGPIMLGPSSSHTAGAARLGYLAQKIYGEPIKKVEIILNEPFAQTYKGHGSDKALLGGLIGLEPDNPKIRKAFQIAREKNLHYQFDVQDLGSLQCHANTVKFILPHEKFSLEILGSSIGAGNIIIFSINNIAVNITGQHHSLLVFHQDKLGILAKLTNIIAEEKINIASLHNSRKGKGMNAITSLALDNTVKEKTIKKIYSLAGIDLVRYLTPFN